MPVGHATPNASTANGVRRSERTRHALHDYIAMHEDGAVTILPNGHLPEIKGDDPLALIAGLGALAITDALHDLRDILERLAD